MSELSRIYPPSYHAFDFSPERFGLIYKIRRRLEARLRLVLVSRAARRCSHHRRRLRRWLSSQAAARSASRPGPSKGSTSVPPRSPAPRQAGLTVHEGKAETLHLPQAAYDLVLLIQTVEHIESPPETLAAVRRLLRPGGRVVIVTDNTLARLQNLRRPALGRLPFSPALESLQSRRHAAAGG